MEKTGKEIFLSLLGQGILPTRIPKNYLPPVPGYLQAWAMTRGASGAIHYVRTSTNPRSIKRQRAEIIRLLKESASRVLYRRCRYEILEAIPGNYGTDLRMCWSYDPELLSHPWNKARGNTFDMLRGVIVVERCNV
jgi:hypothetical protein